MEGLHNELREWAASEMGLPPQHVPSVSASKRLCVRQCADIWRFVISHVRSHRNAKIIKGNVLWYGSRKESAGSHKEKKILLEEISELKSKLQHDELKLKWLLPELTASLSTMESNYEKLRDVQRRSLLLTAYLRKKEQERAKLEETNNRIERHIHVYEEIEKKSNVKINLELPQSESVLAGASLPALEPAVLRDVKKATLMRYEFLKSLAHDSISESIRDAENEKQRRVSHQHWLSVVENVLTSHPANHILAALEHLAQQNTQNLKQLTASTDIHSEIEALKFRFGKSHLEDVSEARNMLPSVQVLMQEGWGECEELWVQQIPLRARVKRRLDRLTSLVKEFLQHLSEKSDSSENCQLERDAFDLELKYVILKAFRDTLLNQCHALEDENSKKTKQKCALKEKQLQIQQFRKLVARKQEQIQILIAGNSCSKSELKKSQVEVQQFVQMKVVLPVNEMTPEVSVLYGAVDQEVQQFRNISLPSLQRVTLDELHRVPMQELSIYRFDSPPAPGIYDLQDVCQRVTFPPYKAADKFFMHLSDLKAEQMRLQQQVIYCTEKVNTLQQQILSQQPEAQVLIQRIKEQDDEQIRELVPLVKRITEDYTRNLEQAREVQRAINDWWVQPAQFALPDERRYGLNMRDWQDRWLVAVKNTWA
ncbi:HAUS augmin-like complex subunit 5 [Pleurodeles waltl]